MSAPVARQKRAREGCMAQERGQITPLTRASDPLRSGPLNSAGSGFADLEDYLQAV